MLKKKKIYDIVLFIKKITERCPSGLRSWSWKPVTRQSRGFESHPLRQFYHLLDSASWRSTQEAEGAPLLRE